VLYFCLYCYIIVSIIHPTGFCQLQLGKILMYKFSEIEQLRHVVKYMEYRKNINKDSFYPVMNFTGTVKLHGTNAGVRKIDGRYVPQSRERELTIEEDNHGFAAFISKIPVVQLDWLFSRIALSEYSDDLTLYGEWIGPGIQKGVAISQLPTRQWVLFGGKSDGENFDVNKDIELPEYNIYSIYRVPTYNITIDFDNPKLAIPTLEELTSQVEQSCPWGKLFGVEGVGEGIVWKSTAFPWNSDMFFKTKGEKHSQRGPKAQIAVDPEKVRSIEECVDVILGEGRLLQGLQILKAEVGDIDMDHIGKFLQWVCFDTQKEEIDVVEANDLTWKDVQKEVTKRAKQFYKRQLDEY